jgi:putative hydroxymethylpyrimidine transport system substrate-binding protein
LVLALVALLAMTALAACGNDAGDATSTPSGAGAATSVVSPTVGSSSVTPSTSASPTGDGAATPTDGSASPVASGDLTKVSLALDWYPWSNHTGLYMAQADGDYAAEGLDPNIYVPSDPTTALQLVAAGQDDFTISYETDVLLARAQGLPVVSIAALVQHPLNSIMTLQSSGITDPSMLKGKTIGITGVPSDEALLKTVLATVDLSMDDVETVNVGYDLMPALLGKRVDAVIGAYGVHEGILAAQQGQPVNIIQVEKYGVPDYYELVLVTSEDMIAKHADTVQHFVNAVVKGYAAAQANPQQAVDQLVKAYPETDAAVEQEGIKEIIPLWTDDGAVPFGNQTEERWTSYETFLKDHGVLESDVDATKAFTNEFVAKAHQE